MKNKLAPYFKRNTIGFKVFLLTVIYLFVLVAALSPFIFIKEANKTFAIILVAVISTIYVVVLLIYIWDWYKGKYNSDKKE